MGWIIIGLLISLFILFYVFSRIKNKIWDEPRQEILSLNKKIKELEETHENEKNRIIKNCYDDINNLKKIHKEELAAINSRLEKDKNSSLLISIISDTISAFEYKEMNTLYYNEFAIDDYNFLLRKKDKSSFASNRFRNALTEEYKLKYLYFLFPILKTVFSIPNEKSDTTVKKGIEQSISNTMDALSDTDVVKIVKMIYKDDNSKFIRDYILLKNRNTFLESATSNLKVIPYMAKIMADYETYDIEHLAKELDWGYNYQRKTKVASIREIRHTAQLMVEKYKNSQYQLDYLLALFPTLQDVIETDYNQLPIIKVEDFSNQTHDGVRDYLTKEEYNNLTTTERNQLALDRYQESRKKSKWQIGRDYELYIGFLYKQKGYEIDYFGEYMGMDDLGRDIIAKKDKKTLIIQCKYWSKKKQIHEKHVTQLYGTMISYCVENGFSQNDVTGILITNIHLSDTARKIARFLKIEVQENIPTGNYPCIKCNIGHDSNGTETKIYHLPFDQQYDSTKINKEGEFFALTVREAEEAGFRRAFKWFGNN